MLKETSDLHHTNLVEATVNGCHCFIVAKAIVLPQTAYSTTNTPFVPV